MKEITELMNLLVVGNGFDLAHELPTKYSDFLDYLTLYIATYEKNWSYWGSNGQKNETNHYRYYGSILYNISVKLKKNSKVNALFKETSEQFKAMLEEKSPEKFYENTFVRYCLYIYSYKQTFNKEFNWIDIENELLNFLNDVSSKNITKSTLSNLSVYLPRRENDKLNTIQFYIPTATRALRSKDIPPEFFRKEVFDHLFKELEEFSVLLKFYLKLVQESFKSNAKKIFQINAKDTDGGYHGIFIDGIVSFNYTDTARLYASEAKMHFINGSLANEKIILGVENPSPEKTRNYCSDDIHLFFKNVQRVLYDFSYEYRKSYRQDSSSLINLNGKNQLVSGNHVYIMGHSLAVSDKYILIDLMMNSDTVTIYYYTDKDKYDKIANLYTLLGDELFSKHVNNPVGRPYIRLFDQSCLLK